MTELRSAEARSAPQQPDGILAKDKYDAHAKKVEEGKRKAALAAQKTSPVPVHPRSGAAVEKSTLSGKHEDRQDSAAGATDDQAPRRVGGEGKEPTELNRVKPQYPEAARKARMQGVVILEAVITKSGDVDSVRVLRGLGPLLDNAAIRAVQQWKYRPATFNGEPVPVYLTVTTTFTLQ